MGLKALRVTVASSTPDDDAVGEERAPATTARSGGSWCTVR